jgi:ATP-binding cassette subfamily B protein
MEFKEDRLLTVINGINIFSGLPDEDKSLLSKKLSVKNIQLGHSVVKEGEDINEFLYVYSGSLRKKKQLNGTVYSIGKVLNGEYSGEVSLIAPSKWEYSLNAMDESIVLGISVSDPGLKRIFKSIENKVIFEQLKARLKNIVNNKNADDAWLNNLTANTFITNYKPGETIFSQDEANTSLYLVHSGKVEIIRSVIEGRFTVGFASKDEFIGEYGALSGRRQGYDAIAFDDTTVIEIPNAFAAAIFDLNSELRDHFIKNIESYEAEEKRLRIAKEHDDKTIEFPEFDEGEKIKKFPWHHQHDEMDCGAACLTMITKFYGYNVSEGLVRELANVSVSGASMGAVCKAGENLGYRTRALKLTYPSLRNLRLPAIVHWQGYHWIVLFRISKDFVWVSDPAIGIRKLSHEEFKKSWTGYAIELEPTLQLEEIKPAQNPIFRYLRYLAPMKFFLFEIFLAALVLNVLGLASPLFIQAIIDNVIVYKDVSLLNMMLMGMVIVAIFSTAMGGVQQLIIALITAKLDLRMLAEFFKYVLSLPMRYFYTHKIGDTITRFGENSKIRAILTDASISTVLNIIMIVLYLTMMFLYNMTLTLVVLAFIPLFIGMTLVFTPVFKKISNEQFLISADQSSYMIEAISGIETIKANGTEWSVRNKWEEIFLKAVNLGFKSQRIGLFSGILSQTINTASTVAILWVGANQVIEGRLTVGELMAFNALIGSVMGPIMSIISLWERYQSVVVAMDRLNDVYEIEPEEPAPTPGKKPKIELPRCEGGVELRNLQFRYGSEDSPLVLRDINLEIKPGQRIAFVGQSGCGKSTLIKMIPGFIMPTGGSILIDGVDTKSVSLTSLRRSIGMVLQESFLFSGSVTENIALGDENPDMNRVYKAADMAAAHEFIVNFPKGYDTVIGEKGMAVSGGQKQRICIARALYRDPKILIFDEATSALDAESEKRITENLSTILSGRTSFTIAHRLSTVRNADVICYLGNGVILEKGTHDELVKQRGLYYQLAHDQLGIE